MTKARLFYLTEPCRGIYVVNWQTDTGEIQRMEISRDQLGNFLVDGTASAHRTHLDVLRATADRLERQSTQPTPGEAQ